jgi:hypothetical protein
MKFIKRGDYEVGFPVVCLKDGNFLHLFNSLKEAHEYFYRIVEHEKSKEEVWDAINFGIDTHKSWDYDGAKYDFRSTKEVQEERANRLTRKLKVSKT